jgi:hypothetical protein
MPREIVIDRTSTNGVIRYMACWHQDYNEPLPWLSIFASASVRNVNDHYIVGFGHETPERAREYGYLIETERIIGVKHDRGEADNLAHKSLLRAVKGREARRVRTVLTDLVES